MTTPLLALRGLTKAYPGVIANRDVSLSILPGEIHALLGENGAGKSTLVKTIYGLVRPDSGEMALNGAPFAPSDPRAARDAGVAMVFQHFSLFEALSVAENIALGMEHPPRPRDLAARITTVSQTYGLPLDPTEQVANLSAGARQRVEILRCLLQNPKLLIMDEPTSVLTPQEVDILFATLQQLRDEGTSILYISHKLEEIRSLCDSATILRQGQVVGECDPRSSSAREMAEQMVGGSLHVPERSARSLGEVVLQLNGLSAQAHTPLKDISLELRAGEILGIGGVAGNGQDELLAAISGELTTRPGMVQLMGQPIGQLTPQARREMAILSAPEERLGHSAAPAMSLVENTLLTGRHSQELAPGGFIRWSRARAFAQKIISTFDVRTPSPDAMARQLSGGNLQKFVIGREIIQAPRLLVINQPTWGVDAQAAASIRQALLDLADQGAAILVISQDLDELMEISDRFCALNAGQLSAARPAAGLSMEDIGLMLGGAHDLEPAHA